MKGLVKYALGPGNLAVQDVPEPDMRPGHVKIEVRATGICGTDLHIYAHEYPCRPPVVLGHEVAGIVVDADGTDHIAPGDAVTALPTVIVCGACRYCQEGQLSLCPTRLSFGSGIQGAFTRYLVVPAWSIRKLPAHIDCHSGAMSEPLSCCVKAVSLLTRVTAGDIVVVTGPGPIGLLTAQVARAEGAYVILTGTSIDRERLALGARWVDLTVNIEEENLDEIVKDLTDGHGADIVLECSGSAAATCSGIDLLRKEGILMQIGLHGRPFEIDLFKAELKEITLRTSFSGSLQSWDRTMTLLRQKKIELAPIVSDVLPITEWKTAFDRLHRKEGMKILLSPVD
ncbi:MAG: alcohol dehydrogenase catalytic domain-containing protein [candidate division Zixibacteria bacterium]|nr:alcohol dehydrogenase catalytic domain-containing protein [candidate division Zixibacteria bacterium]